MHRGTLQSFFLAALLLPSVAYAAEIAVHTYQSSVDGITLQMTTIYPGGAIGCPILVVMHGYSGGMAAVGPTQILLAERGLFTVAPSMRGRDGSQGAPDDSAWELFDIVDAIHEVNRLYPTESDEGNVNIVGYSGGGGNVFGLMAKCPATFRLAAAFFGMSDYGHDPAYGWYYYGGQSYQEILRERIGGAPEEVPDRYMARASLLAVRNNRYTTFQMYVDSEEATCPAYNDTAYLGIARQLELENVTLNLSTPDSTYRWYHGYPSNHPDLVAAFDYFVPGILDGIYPRPILDPGGESTIIGFLEVQPFRVSLTDGASEVADLAYDITGDATHRDTAWRFDLASRTGEVDPIRLSLRGLAPLTPYLLEHEDLTGGATYTIGGVSDSEGSVGFSTFLDTVSVLRVYQGSPGSIEDAWNTHDLIPNGSITSTPNPFRTEVSILLPGWNDRRDGSERLRILNTEGRQVATLSPHRRSLQEGTIYRWDGREATGGEIPNGLYFLVAPPGSGLGAAKLIRTR